jgi:Rps23 Pro-64 3,4-dihydroxylase Tpa1-like proline 4-hydroxylase
MDINPGLDIAGLSASFARRGRLVIGNLLVPPDAERLHACLASETPWGLAYHDGTGPQQIDAAQLATLPAADVATLNERVERQAGEAFRYRYRCYPMVDAYLQRKDPHLMLHAAFELLNSPPMLERIRAITGLRQIVRADAQATLYAPGDFLTLHNDFDPRKGRLLAYVMSFARNWRPDYGGLLQFLDAENNIEEGFLPRFNAMMIFRVPQNHAVTYVPPFAPLGRYSITGWFQDATAVPASAKARYGL